MRRTTLILLAILAVGMGSLLYAMKAYTDRFAVEIRNAKSVTTELAERLEPGTSIRLARVDGQAKYVVTDPQRPGLLVEAQPRRASWEKDPTGEGFARDAAAHLLLYYDRDRAVSWMQFRLTRPDGSAAPVLGLEKGPDGKLRRIEARPGG